MIKKQGLYPEILKKNIEKAIATQIHDHLQNNDIAITIGRCNGAMLVLHDLSAAFDTIDHDNLLCILEKYVGICGNGLNLIKSYFSYRTQCVQIDDVFVRFC